ncbi:MAG: NUDIX domain-containing protein [Planctomycetota bacterium]|nr:NUDIX domain-containing protein [Planctomycetota bacterium]MDA1164869.1 NUDIX domain-containing protein [Planctomycetota bacterium]
MSRRSPKQIGIAIVEHHGCYLVGARQSGQELAGYSEFPGGKCELGESVEDCVVRECREETGLNVAPVRQIDRTCHEYDHAIVDLHFWLCRVEANSDDPSLKMPLLRNNFQWKPVDELRQLSFPEANARVVELLAGNSGPTNEATGPGTNRTT